MTDETSAKIRESRGNFTADHLAMYLESGGAEGHIVDLRVLKAHQFTTTLLLRTTGRKSGETRTTPLIYGDLGGEVVVVASKGGADKHPAWYLNITGNKEVEFQVATQAFRATWREAQGAERAKVWEFMEGVFPPYKDYQASTSRQIPLVMMSPFEAIEIFKE